MKTLKYLFLGLVALAATSCDQKLDTYTPSPDDVDKVFFQIGSVTTEFPGDATGDQTISVIACRVAATEAASIDITADYGEGADEFIDIPAQIYFEEGVYQKNFDITVHNVEDLAKGATYQAAISVAPATSESIKVSGYSKVTFTVSVALEYNLLGIGLYTDDLITGVFNVGPETYEVEVYTATGIDGVYYLKNAYTTLYPYNEPGDYVTDDVMFTIDASDPNEVFLPVQDLGMDWGYGMFSVATVAPGTLANGVITFPARSFYIAMADYNGGAWSFYGNPNGAFRLVLPN